MTRKQQAGFTIIELVMVVVLALLVMLCIVLIYKQVKPLH